MDALNRTSQWERGNTKKVRFASVLVKPGELLRLLPSSPAVAA